MNITLTARDVGILQAILKIRIIDSKKEIREFSSIAANNAISDDLRAAAAECVKQLEEDILEVRDLIKKLNGGEV